MYKFLCNGLKMMVQTCKYVDKMVFGVSANSTPVFQIYPMVGDAAGGAVGGYSNPGTPVSTTSPQPLAPHTPWPSLNPHTPSSPAYDRHPHITPLVSFILLFYFDESCFHI